MAEIIANCIFWQLAGLILIMGMQKEDNWDYSDAQGNLYMNWLKPEINEMLEILGD